MDWNKEEFIVRIINRDNEVKDMIIRVIKNKDYSFLASLISSLDDLIKDRMINKEIKLNILQIIAWNLNEPTIFDNEMNLKEGFKFLEEHKNLLLKNIFQNEDTIFTENQLKNISDEHLIFMLPENSEIKYKESNLISIMEEISKRIQETNLDFSNFTTEEIKKYLQLASNHLYKKDLVKLINNEKFLNVFDANNISVEKLLEWTENCENPRLKLLETKKVKKALHDSAAEISDLLSKEEVLITWKNIDIKNVFITKGLRFDCLDTNSQRLLLEDTDTFKVYNLKTIDEFIKGYENINILAENIEFIFVYLSKITKDNVNYCNSSILLNNLNTMTIEYLLDDLRIDSISKEAILYLITSLKPENISLILTNKKIYNIVKENKSLYPFMNLPIDIQIDVLTSKESILKDNKLKKLLYNSKQGVVKEVFKEKKFFEEFIALLANSEKNFEPKEIEYILLNISKEQFSDFVNNQLTKLNGDTILYFLSNNSDLFKKIILDSKELIVKIFTSVNKKNSKEFITCLNKLSDSEKISLITKNIDIDNIYALKLVIDSIDELHKRELYNNKNIRNKILKSSNKYYIIDDLTKEYLLSNPKEIIELQTNALCEFLEMINEVQLKTILTNDEIILRILKDYHSKTSNLMISLINKHNIILKYLNKPEYSKYISKDLFYEIIENLTLEEKNAFCENINLERIVFDNNPKIYKIYKGLLDKNRYLLDTLIFPFLNENTILLKFSTLENLTKNKLFQQTYLKLSQKIKIPNKLLMTLLNVSQNFNTENELTDILNVICESVYGNNRKKVGNFEKILMEVDFEKLNIQDYYKLISYLLYMIPRYKNADLNLTRPVKIIDVPSTFEEMLEYEINLIDEIERLSIKEDSEEYKNYFFIKHYKMTLEEIECFISRYNIDKVDEKVYKEEMKFIKELNDLYEKDNLELKSLTKHLKIHSMLEIYNIEKKIKEMYSKIYNYELRIYSKASKVTNLSLYGKTISIYEPKDKFIFLVNSIPLESFINPKYNDYLDAWNNYINSNSKHIVTNLISNDNLSINSYNTLIVGFDSISFNSIKKMAPYSLENYNVQKFMVPRNLINNTRESCNNIILNKYEERTNHLNSNNPNIIPDYIIIFKDLLFANGRQNNAYLEKNYRASLDFKSKNHPKGLPIIMIDREKLVVSELTNLNESIKKYTQNNSVTLFSKCLNKFENNKTGYILSHSKLVDAFNENIILSPLKNRIYETNSLAELEYLKDIILEEKEKYTHPELLKVTYQKINYDNILELIEKHKRKVLNKQSN